MTAYVHNEIKPEVEKLLEDIKLRKNKNLTGKAKEVNDAWIDHRYSQLGKYVEQGLILIQE